MDLRELPDHVFARHPWELARAGFFVRLLRERLGPGPLRALDVGAGDGYLARRLLAEIPALGRVTCYDPGYDTAFLAARRGGDDRLEFTAAAPRETFDLVLLLDVLEHSDDDRALLGQAAALGSAPRGLLLASAPAHPRLFSRHDVLLGHRRRYPPGRFRRLVASAGLEILAHGQLFSSLLVPRTLAKLVEFAAGARSATAPAPEHVETALGSWHHGPMVTRAVTVALSLDALTARLAARWRVPLPGLSTWVLARRS
jgi:SAM-dependent methyltransferase